MIDLGTYDRLIARLKEGKSFLISSHVRLDGDGLGSALAMDSLVRQIGRKSMVLLPGAVPVVYQFLPGVERVATLDDVPTPKVPADVDTFIALDVADTTRLGGVPKLLPLGVFTASVAHHHSGTLKADVECDDPDAASTGELVYDLIKRGGFDITPDIATNIFAAIMSDTQRFSLPNTDAKCLTVAGEMVERGANPGDLGDRLYRSWQHGSLALWAEVASRIRLDPSGKLAWTSMTLEMLGRYKVHADDTQDFADIPRMLAGVEVGVLFREFEKGVRVSLRSNRIPILSVAEQFKGGGHQLACGCELSSNLADSQVQVLAAVREALAKSGPPAEKR